MKNYDFETVICREGVGSGKWDEISKTLGYTPEGVIPFSVADMEFMTAPEIVEGLKRFLDTNVLGYAQPTDAYKNAVKSWMKKRHGWDIDTQWIKDTHGVINAFFTAVKAFTKEGEGVMLMTPVYYPMYFAVSRNNRVLVENKLIRTGDTYEIDFDDFEEKAKDENTKLLILCSPHNPSGRVWSQEELERIGRICIDNHVLIVSDEIHFDLISPGYHHTVFASISEEFAQNCIVCTAPSKTFNLAGNHLANIIIPDQGIRDRWNSLYHYLPNPISAAAATAAYEKGEPWLDELNQYLAENFRRMETYLKANLPAIGFQIPEATYLAWINIENLGPDHGEIENRFIENGLIIEGGDQFVENGEGFIRLNAAVPRSIIDTLLNKINHIFN